VLVTEVTFTVDRYCFEGGDVQVGKRGKGCGFHIVQNDKLLPTHNMGKKAFQMLLEPGSNICIGIDAAIQEHLHFGHDIKKAHLGS
jgi:hypothetical protein